MDQTLKFSSPNFDFADKPGATQRASLCDGCRSSGFA